MIWAILKSSPVRSAIKRNIGEEFLMLFDSDVMIDILRGYRPAVAWLEKLVIHAHSGGC